MKNAAIFWFTGLSGSGKSTVAEGVRPLLEREGLKTLVLDGDQIRKELHSHLGFSEQEIKANNAAIAELCLERRADYDVILVPIISPFEESRRLAEEALKDSFYEVYFCATLDCVAQRDVKGLYAKAKKGLIPDMIGLSGVTYEPPSKPDHVVDSSCEGTDASVAGFLRFVLSKRKPS